MHETIRVEDNCGEAITTAVGWAQKILAFGPDTIAVIDTLHEEIRVKDDRADFVVVEVVGDACRLAKELDAEIFGSVVRVNRDVR